MKIAWVSLLDFDVFGGGGELGQRDLVRAGRERGHTIIASPYLRERPQRAARRTRVWRRLRIEWDADLFVLANLRNSPHPAYRIPDGIVQRVLDTGRAAIWQDAWVDTCVVDMACGGSPVRCPARCSREWENWLWSQAALAIFLSPMQARMTASVLDVPLPRTIIRRPYVDVDAFKPMDLERDIDVLYVGHINEAKGYHNLLARFGPERLTFVGRNSLGKPIEGTYLGEREYWELPAIFNRARVFAHLPKWYEPLGRTVIEAGLCGCELVVNERVGAMSFNEEDRSDPTRIATSLDAFWDELETATGDLR